MSKAEVSVGCVGVGGRGQYLLRSLLEIPGVVVTAVCDTDPKNNAAAAKLVSEAGQKSPAQMEHWDKLLARSGVDAVVSALPCDLHAENYLAVIAAGKDLYGEKPMCLSVPECNAVVDAADATDRIVQIGFQRRADPRFIEPVQEVHAGELGELVEGRVAWARSWAAIRPGNPALHCRADGQADARYPAGAADAAGLLAVGIADWGVGQARSKIPLSATWVHGARGAGQGLRAVCRTVALRRMRILLEKAPAGCAGSGIDVRLP